MRDPEPHRQTIDYRQAHASAPYVPHPPVLTSSGWESLHVEVHQQPKFEIAEHHHTMHVIACRLPEPREDHELALAASKTEVGANGTTGVKGERWLDGKRETERRQLGDMAIIPAGISHRCNWNTTVRFGILAIEPFLLQEMGQDWVNPDRIELTPQFMNKRDDLIQGIYSALQSELEMNDIGGNLLVDSLKTALAIHLLRNYCTTSPRLSSYGNGLSAAKLQLVTDYIHAHLDLDLKLTELSAIAQISPYHFLRLFKKNLNVTPHQYILRQRIQRAKDLLRFTHLDISEIAIRVGFCDSSHLTRTFKKFLDKAPSHFRQL